MDIRWARRSTRSARFQHLRYRTKCRNLANIHSFKIFGVVLLSLTYVSNINEKVLTFHMAMSNIIFKRHLESWIVFRTSAISVCGTFTVKRNPIIISTHPQPMFWNVLLKYIQLVFRNIFILVKQCYFNVNSPIIWQPKSCLGQCMKWYGFQNAPASP